MKILLDIAIAFVIVIMVAIVAVAAFGPFIAWCIWGDHMAIGALCLSAAISGGVAVLAKLFSALADEE